MLVWDENICLKNHELYFIKIQKYLKNVLMKKKMDRIFNTKLPVLSNKQIYEYKEKRGPWKWTWIKLKSVNYIDDKKNILRACINSDVTEPSAGSDRIPRLHLCHHHA